MKGLLEVVESLLEYDDVERYVFKSYPIEDARYNPHLNKMEVKLLNFGTDRNQYPWNVYFIKDLDAGPEGLIEWKWLTQEPLPNDMALIDGVTYLDAREEFFTAKGGKAVDLDGNSYTPKKPFLVYELPKMPEKKTVPAKWNIATSYEVVDRLGDRFDFAITEVFVQIRRGDRVIGTWKIQADSLLPVKVPKQDVSGWLSEVHRILVTEGRFTKRIQAIMKAGKMTATPKD